ncbi:MAG: AraC family transcriptional regulator [Pseudomonas sp.]|nr:AraC family transcriptional regulator [Pseudomonas sp.]
MLKPGKHPQDLYKQDQPPTFNVTSQAVGWKGAFFADVRGRAHGVTDHGHVHVCLQWFDAPRHQRKTGSSATWEALAPGLRIWLPGDEQRFETCGVSNNRFLFVERGRVEQIMDSRWQPQAFERHRGRMAHNAMAEHLLAAMSQDLYAGSPAGALVGDSLITALIASVCAGHAQPDGESLRAKLSQREISLLREYVDGGLDQRISLDDLAALVNLSQRHFRRLLHATLALSPHQFVTAQRLERARQLITDSRAALAEIAAATGFADQSHMSRSFQRTFGIAPSHYREQNKVSKSA